MAELERLANHFGDIGAICNDASFSIMHAQCGILRERVLRAADACFGHRLMMDRIVPGGVARDIAADGVAAVARAARRNPPAFPAAGRALRQHRLAAGPHRRPPASSSRHCARQFGAGGYVGRASGRAFDARRTPGYAPYDALDFEVPVLDDGDVNARVWIRIREVEQSLALIEQILDALPDGADHAPTSEPARPAKAWRWSKASAATCWSGCGSTPTAASSAAICATRPGSSGRCWRPRSRATSSPTSRSATNRSTAPIRGTISRHAHAQARCSRSLIAARR